VPAPHSIEINDLRARRGDALSVNADSQRGRCADCEAQQGFALSVKPDTLRAAGFRFRA